MKAYTDFKEFYFLTEVEIDRNTKIYFQCAEDDYSPVPRVGVHVIEKNGENVYECDNPYVAKNSLKNYLENNEIKKLNISDNVFKKAIALAQKELNKFLKMRIYSVKFINYAGDFEFFSSVEIKTENNHIIEISFVNSNLEKLCVDDYLIFENLDNSKIDKKLYCLTSNVLYRELLKLTLPVKTVSFIFDEVKKAYDCWAA